MQTKQLCSHLLALYFCILKANAAPILEPSHVYVLKRELKQPGMALKHLDNSYFETKIDFQSFDLNSKTAQPILSSQTDQLVKMKALPRDAQDLQAIKDGLDHRVEIVFERLLTVSAVKVQGLAKPFETRQDLGIFLMNKPIVLRGNGKISKRVEGLSALLAKAKLEVKDPIAQSTLLGLMKEELLLQAVPSTSHESSCLGAFDKKLPGAKWGYSREEQGLKLEFGCEFEGWAEVSGKKVAVLKMQGKKMRVQRQQPNGVPGMTETESSGQLYFEPEAQEVLMRVETNVLAEPMEGEIQLLKAKGEAVPRNRTRMWNTTRIYQ